jgi:hypothetical protein
MIDAALLATTFVAFLLLCATNPRHMKALVGGHLRYARAIRAAGWIGLAASFGATAAVFGGAYGTVVWCGMAAIAAVAVVLLLTYRCRRTPNRTRPRR